MEYRLIIILLFFVMTGCNSAHDERIIRSSANCEEWLSNDYAEFFAVRVCEEDTVLFLLNPDDAADTLAVFPVGASASPRIATISTTHVPMIAEVSGLDPLVGVGYADYISDEAVQQRLKDGSLRAITSADQLNFETVIEIDPDLLLVYPYGNENYDVYRNAEITVLPISEYAESHPLGRTEWIKVMGLLTGNYTKAAAFFEETTAQYHLWHSRAVEQKEKPVVFTGSFYKGRWSAPAGESFIARFITDAGAEYAFADYPGNHNTELDFEVVLRKIAEADFFGKVLHRESKVTREDFMEDNARFELIRSFSDEQLFYCNTVSSDYFGRGLLEPDVMLRDLYHIFHEGATTSQDSVFVYFKPLAI